MCEERMGADGPQIFLPLSMRFGLRESGRIRRSPRALRMFPGCSFSGSAQDLGPVARQARLPAQPERGFVERAREVRREMPRFVHDLERQVAVLVPRGRAGRRRFDRARAGAPRRSRRSGSGKVFWSAQTEKGGEPADATPIPCLCARLMISVRSSPTSRRTSPMSAQMPDPISTTDWCISGLTRSFKCTLPSSSSCWTCERSSRVSGPRSGTPPRRRE
jgi:hypothetical protein